MNGSEDSMKIVTLEGNLTIDRAEEIKKEILSVLNSAGRVLVNMSHIDGIDISFIQILYAAKKEARNRGKEFHLTGSVKEQVLKAFILAGITKGSSYDARELENTLLDFSSPGKD